MPTSSSLQQLHQNANLSESWTQPVAASPYPAAIASLFPLEEMQAAQSEISQWSEYQPTSLLSLNKIADAAGVGQVLYKDESTRLGLGSFKALGGAYAVLHYLSRHLSAESGNPIKMAQIRQGQYTAQTQSLTVSTATDGNHGRSVAWGAKQAGCACKIYIHRDVSVGREQAMAALDADVIRIDGDYDESVRQCALDTEKHGWQMISDTSYEGYRDIPRQVMAGYTMMVREILMLLRVHRHRCLFRQVSAALQVLLLPHSGLSWVSLCHGLLWLSLRTPTASFEVCEIKHPPRLKSNKKPSWQDYHAAKCHM